MDISADHQALLGEGRIHSSYLIEGLSGSGKTTVATALERRGYRVIHGDRELAYQGDPGTGAPVDNPQADPRFINAHHIWDVARVKAIIAGATHGKTFFCGAARNRRHFVHLFDAVFLLEVDRATLIRRIDSRRDEWGSKPQERAEILRLYDTREDLPLNAIAIDATQPVDAVIDAILSRCV